MRTLVLALAPAMAEAQEGRGFAEVRGSVAAGVDGVPWQLVERVRPTFTTQANDRVALTATLEAGLVQGRDLQDELQRTLEESDLGPFLELAGCEWPTHENDVLRIDGVEDYLYVDRLYVDVYSEHADVRVGRQSVYWGSAQFLNPTDPFPELLLAEPWRPRRGVNAVRATVPWKAHDFTAVVGANDAFTGFRAAGRARFNAAETDFALVGAYRQDSDDGFVGVDIRGTLGIGFWLEGALKLDEDPHEEIAVGIDYSFPVLENVIVGAQYYRNGGGGEGGLPPLPFEPPECTADVPFPDPGDPDPFAPVLTGRDYVLLNAMVLITQDVSVTLAALQNAGDGTGLVLPTATVRPTGWLEVSGSAQLPVRTWGDGGELSPRDEDMVFETPVATVDLSGMVPDATFFLWTRASF